MKAKVLALGLLIAIFFTGCLQLPQNGNVHQTVKVTPSKQAYPFINEDPILKEKFYKFYDTPNSSPVYLSARLTSPYGKLIKFDSSYQLYTINEFTTFQFEEGVYPFSIYSEDGKYIEFVGALAVFNVDETIALATFGLDEKTKLFNQEMLDKAREGVLASYTVSFDDKNVMHYWLGNRSQLYPGGDPTVEVDFSKNPNIQDLKIDGKKPQHMRATLPVGKSDKLQCFYCDRESVNASSFSNTCWKSNAPKKTHKIKNTWGNTNYPLEITTTDGKRFQGYIRNLKDNVFTSFLSVPCAIPENLFDQASKGTIAKLTVHSSGDEREEIAEIVFGVAR